MTGENVSLIVKSRRVLKYIQQMGEKKSFVKLNDVSKFRKIRLDFGKIEVLNQFGNVL